MNETQLDRTPEEKSGLTLRASWQFSADAIAASTKHFSQSEQDALMGLFRWCIDPLHPVAKVDAAKGLGVSENLLYKIFTGRYRNDATKELQPFPEKLETRIRQFLSSESARYEGGALDFVYTHTADRVFTTCNLARESQTPAFIWGPSHIGKTWPLERYAAAENHGRTIYARLRAASGLGGMIRRIADRCGISDKGNTSALIERIKNALNKYSLLILDEMHLLAGTYRKQSFHACMEVIREIHDEVKCGMVLSWTDIDEVKAASQKELQQFWRRGCHKVPLPLMPTKADLVLILEANGFHFPDESGPKNPDRFPQTVVAQLEKRFNSLKSLSFPFGQGSTQIIERPYEALRQLAEQQGLKAVTERIRYARKFATRTTGRISWEKFCEAHLTIEAQAIQTPKWS